MKTKRLCLDLALLSIKHYKHYSTTCFFRENAAKSKAWQKTRSPGVWYQRGPKLWCFLALLSLQGFVCLIQLFVAPQFFHSLRHAASHFVLLEKPRCHRTRDRDSGMPPGNSIPSIIHRLIRSVFFDPQIPWGLVHLSGAPKWQGKTENVEVKDLNPVWHPRSL